MPHPLAISSAAISNKQIRQVVCPKSCACRADSCVQVSRSPDPHRGRASATNSRGLAKATSRMDRARRRVSHVRFLRGAPEAAPRNLCPVGTGRNSFAARARSLLPSSLMRVGSKTRRGELGPVYACHGVASRRRVAHPIRSIRRTEPARLGVFDPSDLWSPISGLWFSWRRSEKLE